MNLLHNYYPYKDNLESAHQLLLSIQKILHAHEFSPATVERYRVSLGTLAAISLAASRRNIELNLLAWDLADAFGYAPPESMFEDVVMSFAAAQQDENMYAALVDMEAHGFVPSRALLRYIALKVSYKMGRLQHSSRMLSWHENDHLRSIHSMNALLIGFGMQKDINSSFSIFEELSRFELTPDANTFIFLMEILYLDTKDRFPCNDVAPPPCTPADVADVLGAAQIILDDQAAAGISKSPHFFKEHLRLLCALGRLEEAHAVFREALAAGPVPSASLFLLATRFAQGGDFARALEVAAASVAAGCGDLPLLRKRIRHIEDRDRGRC